MEEVKLVKRFDKDGDNRLNNAERKAAREYLASSPRGRQGFGPRGGGPPFGGFGQQKQETPKPGEKLSPAGVKTYGDEPLYDMKVLRTLFLEFENADWEKELSDFYKTDVEVPAKLTVDGKVYPDVGVHFRGMTSYMMTPEGRKRSLNLSLDFVNREQRLLGYRTLNLLNSASDPTFLRPVLFMQIARDYIPAPRANYVRVVINGESWGIYVNAEQFNTDFVKEWFHTTAGARWKVPGPASGAGLSYLGEELKPYKRLYDMRSKNDPKAWADLVRLCKVMDETPPDKLEKALEPLLDIDGALKFLAVDNALINNDGYWSRASDYNLYQDPQGRFHIVPHDGNETFQAAGHFGPGGPGGPGFGPPMGGRPGPGGPPGRAGFDPRQGGPGFGPGPRGPQGERKADLDPLAGADDPDKALLSKLLAVPALRARYFGYVRDIAERWLVWDRIHPLAQQYQALILDDIRKDTRKLDTTEAFTRGVTQDSSSEGFFGPGGPPAMGLKSFVEQRHKYLMSHAGIKKAASVRGAAK
jgi:spore coat protein CotH